MQTTPIRIITHQLVAVLRAAMGLAAEHNLDIARKCYSRSAKKISEAIEKVAIQVVMRLLVITRTHLENLQPTSGA